jgi:hypothetical protein
MTRDLTRPPPIGAAENNATIDCNLHPFQDLEKHRIVICFL